MSTRYTRENKTHSPSGQRLRAPWVTDRYAQWTFARHEAFHNLLGIEDESKTSEPCGVKAVWRINQKDRRRAALFAGNRSLIYIKNQRFTGFEVWAKSQANPGMCIKCSCGHSMSWSPLCRPCKIHEDICLAERGELLRQMDFMVQRDTQQEEKHTAFQSHEHRRQPGDNWLGVPITVFAPLPPGFTLCQICQQRGTNNPKGFCQLCAHKVLPKSFETMALELAPTERGPRHSFIPVKVGPLPDGSFRYFLSCGITQHPERTRVELYKIDQKAALELGEAFIRFSKTGSFEPDQKSANPVEAALGILFSKMNQEIEKEPPPDDRS